MRCCHMNLRPLVNIQNQVKSADKQTIEDKSDYSHQTLLRIYFILMNEIQETFNIYKI